MFEPSICTDSYTYDDCGDNNDMSSPPSLASHLTHSNPHVLLAIRNGAEALTIFLFVTSTCANLVHQPNLARAGSNSQL